MKIAVIGSTGRAGSRIITEARQRGHEVTGISRHEEKGLRKSLWDLTQNDLKDFEVVVSAFATWEEQSLHLKAVKHLDNIMKNLESRWIAVGGAGSLFVAEGLRLKDSEGFPAEYKAVADGMAEGLTYLESKAVSNWSYFSPSAIFEPGARTGRYR
ncbi:MAG: NAD-dependent epimerase/dehydratase family protein, partial [Desulfobacula sp.]